MRTWFSHQRPSVVAGAAMAFALASSGSVAAQTTEQAQDVLNKPTEVLSPGLELIKAEDALLTRYEDRLVLEITMDAPTPATYVYPDSVPPERQASPEVFTVWAFVFNHPDACTSGSEGLACGVDDFTEAVKAGAYGVSGHVTAVDHSGGAFELDRGTDGKMVFIGEIKVGDAQRPNSPPDSLNYPLESPMEAEVHVAIAPHGQLDPANIATDLYEPAGNADCGCWWNAFFSAGPG